MLSQASVILFREEGDLCMIIFPAWLPVPMFLPVDFCVWFAVPSVGLCQEDSLPRGGDGGGWEGCLCLGLCERESLRRSVSVWRVSVKRGFCKGVSLWSGVSERVSLKGELCEREVPVKGDLWKRSLKGGLCEDGGGRVAVRWPLTEYYRKVTSPFSRSFVQALSVHIIRFHHRLHLDPVLGIS